MDYQTTFKDKIIDKFVDENYYNMSDLNWKDDTLETGIGDIDGSDPSVKGFNKGWQMDPYLQRYYANYDGGKKMSRLKKAVVEIRDITYSAENYVDELLSISNPKTYLDGVLVDKIQDKAKQSQIDDIKNMKSLVEDKNEQGSAPDGITIDSLLKDDLAKYKADNFL